MDTLKRQDSCLESFPPDIWTYLVCYLSEGHLGRLKMTGSNTLWERISFPGVVKSVIVGRSHLQLTSQASFLLLPTIEKLAIYSENAAWWSKLGLKLNTIPSTIRELRFNGSFGSNFDFFVENGETLNLDEHVPRLEILELGRIEMSNYDWMARSPPSLTRLSIYCWNGQVALPPSLIFFESSKMELRNCQELSLPSGLMCIISDTIDGLDLLIPLLPTSLSQLKSLASQVTKPFSFSRLPMSLTSLHVPIIRSLNFIRFPQIASQFPRNLTELEVSPSFSSESWRYLPPTLKKFTCYSSNVLDCDVTDQLNAVKMLKLPFDDLPPSITELKFLNPNNSPRYFGLPDPNRIYRHYFPPQLSVLTMPLFQISLAVAKLLPSTLTHLSITNLYEDTCCLLPAGLKKLTVSQTLMSPKFFQLLPNSLTHLDLTCALGSCLFQPDDDDSAGTLHFKTLGNAFRWSDWHLGPNVEYTLPPHLTLLRLGNFSQLQDSFLLEQNLTCLHSLTLHSTKISDSAMQRLPSILTALDLSQSHLVTGGCFPLLPRQLTTLNLGSSRTIYDSDVQHLPRTLKVLYLNSAVELTDKCVPHLPRELTLLNLEKNESISPGCFPSLPSALRTSNQSERAIELATWGVRNGEIFCKHRK